VSQILDKLKKAEEERARIIAERGMRDADAARAREESLRERRREEQASPAQTDEPAREQRPRFAAGLGIAVAMAIVFWVGTLMPRKAAPPAQESPAPAARRAEPAAAPAPAAADKAPPPALFRMDADVYAFSSRLKDKP
jgi:hypothetical protein